MQGESPELPRFEALRPRGSTRDVDYWTSKDVRETTRSHVNYVVADSGWEEKATFYLDKHRHVQSFVKNAGLNFTIPYLHNGQMHDFYPDFIVRMGEPDGDVALNLILETKGHDDLKEVKESAAHRWVNAVNPDGRYGRWSFRMAKSVADISYILDEALEPVAAT